MVKRWNAGVADEVWKVHISSRDASRAEDIAGFLAYIMTDIGHASLDQQLDAISKFSGEQIAKALLDYRSVSLRSIAAAINPAPHKPGVEP